MTSNLEWVRRRWPDYRTGDLHPFNEGVVEAEKVTLPAALKACTYCNGTGDSFTYFGHTPCTPCGGTGKVRA